MTVPIKRRWHVELRRRTEPYIDETSYKLIDECEIESVSLESAKRRATRFALDNTVMGPNMRGKPHWIRTVIEVYRIYKYYESSIKEWHFYMITMIPVGFKVADVVAEDWLVRLTAEYEQRHPDWNPLA